MKVKSPSDCGLTKEHDYLGHFKNPVHLDRGHNRNPIDPYESGPEGNTLEGDRPIVKQVDESLGKIKRTEAWDEVVREAQARKEVDKQTDEFYQKKKKEYRVK